MGYKEETKHKATEDKVREDIKESDLTRIQNISSESEIADLVTNKEIKESQEILLESNQQTGSPTEKERKVKLNDIIGGKNKDTKGRRKSNVKNSGTSKKEINNKNITLKDMLSPKKKSSKSLPLDPPIQKSKQPNTQRE